MTALRIERYTAAQQKAWNGFVSVARNGHFLFDRGFMDYHADRFEDASLLIYNDETLCAVLPANRNGEALHSHQGLTFGGFVVDGTFGAPQMLACFEALQTYMAHNSLTSLHYKPLPHIYACQPAQDDLYALFRAGAVLTRRDVTTTIDYGNRGPISKRRQRGIKKAQNNGLSFSESLDYATFWPLLSSILAARHSSVPVHSLDEIVLLASRFPQNIRLFTAKKQTQIFAGVVIFETERVVHAQYICVCEEGRLCGALDGLFSHLIDFYSLTKKYFDFGISNEQNGKILNEGLVTQKEEFGGSSVVHDMYVLTL